RRAQQEHRLKPDMQLNMAGLENGSDLDGEWLPAIVALIDADPGAFAAQCPTAINRTAMGANPTVRPDMSLYESVGGGFAMILRFRKNGRHGLSPCNLIWECHPGTSSIILPIYGRRGATYLDMP